MSVALGLKLSVPPASDEIYEPGDQVRVWHEKVVNNRISELRSTFTVLGMNPRKKLVYV